MRQSWEKIIDAGDATGGVTSGKIDARQCFNLSMVMQSSSGSNAGTVKLQGSNDICAFGNVPSAFTPAAASWVDIPSAALLGSGVVASGATVTLLYRDTCYAWIRAVWTPSAGAGTITAIINTQGI